MPKKKQSKQKPLDLALVEGLKSFIKQLAAIKSLNMLFGDLLIIEKYETGMRRRAIQHIRDNFTPKELGLRVTHPKPRGPNPSTLLAKEFKKVYAVGKQCPLCRHHKIVKSTDGNGTSCPRCGKLMFVGPPISHNYHPDVSKFLHDLHSSQILTRWYWLNDPDPLRF